MPQLWFMFFISASTVLRQVVFSRPRFHFPSASGVWWIATLVVELASLRDRFPNQHHHFLVMMVSLSSCWHCAKRWQWRWYLAKRCVGFSWGSSCERTTVWQGHHAPSSASTLIHTELSLSVIRELSPLPYNSCWPLSNTLVSADYGAAEGWVGPSLQQLTFQSDLVPSWCTVTAPVVWIIITVWFITKVQVYTMICNAGCVFTPFFFINKEVSRAKTFP